MIKVVGVCGSPRKKSMYTALQAALDAAKATGNDVEVELIELRGRKINCCIHCNKNVTFIPWGEYLIRTDMYLKT